LSTGPVIGFKIDEDEAAGAPALYRGAVKQVLFL